MADFFILLFLFSFVRRFIINLNFYSMQQSTERFNSKLSRLQVELDAKQKFASTKDVSWHQSPAGIRYQNRIIRLIRSIRLLQQLIDSINNLFTPKSPTK